MIILFILFLCCFVTIIISKLGYDSYKDYTELDNNEIKSLGDFKDFLKFIFDKLVKWIKCNILGVFYRKYRQECFTGAVILSQADETRLDSAEPGSLSEALWMLRADQARQTEDYLRANEALDGLENAILDRDAAQVFSRSDEVQMDEEALMWRAWITAQTSQMTHNLINMEVCNADGNVVDYMDLAANGLDKQGNTITDNRTGVSRNETGYKSGKDFRWSNRCKNRSGFSLGIEAGCRDPSDELMGLNSRKKFWIDEKVPTSPQGVDPNELDPNGDNTHMNDPQGLEGRTITDDIHAFDVRNFSGYNCNFYAKYFCRDGKPNYDDHSDMFGISNNWPELNCCACGGGSRTDVVGENKKAKYEMIYKNLDPYYYDTDIAYFVSNPNSFNTPASKIAKLQDHGYGIHGGESSTLMSRVFTGTGNGSEASTNWNTESTDTIYRVKNTISHPRVPGAPGAQSNEKNTKGIQYLVTNNGFGASFADDSKDPYPRFWKSAVKSDTDSSRLYFASQDTQRAQIPYPGNSKVEFCLASLNRPEEEEGVGIIYKVRSPGSDGNNDNEDNYFESDNMKLLKDQLHPGADNTFVYDQTSVNTGNCQKILKRSDETALNDLFNRNYTDANQQRSMISQNKTNIILKKMPSDFQNIDTSSNTIKSEHINGSSTTQDHEYDIDFDLPIKSETFGGTITNCSGLCSHLDNYKVKEGRDTFQCPSEGCKRSQCCELNTCGNSDVDCHDIGNTCIGPDNVEYTCGPNYAKNDNIVCDDGGECTTQECCYKSSCLPPSGIVGHSEVTCPSASPEPTPLNYWNISKKNNPNEINMSAVIDIIIPQVDVALSVRDTCHENVNYTDKFKRMCENVGDSRWRYSLHNQCAAGKHMTSNCTQMQGTGTDPCRNYLQYHPREGQPGGSKTAFVCINGTNNYCAKGAAACSAGPEYEAIGLDAYLTRCRSTNPSASCTAASRLEV